MGYRARILVTAKGLSSGYAPLGAVIATRKVVDAIADGSGALLHGYTYNAHPVSLAVGRAVLRRIQSQNLVHAADSGAAVTVGGALKTALESLRDLNIVGDVRGIGLLWGVEFVQDKKTKQPFPPERDPQVRSEKRAESAAFSFIRCRDARTESPEIISSLRRRL